MSSKYTILYTCLQNRLELPVKLPEWTGPALWSAAAGAFGFALVGFNFMGWMLGSTALEMSEKASKTAVVDALTPYCVSASKADPLSAEKFAQLKGATGWKKRSLLEESGWATPLDADRPNRALADACLLALESKT
jgi:hypothetical protein